MSRRTNRLRAKVRRLNKEAWEAFVRRVKEGRKDLDDRMQMLAALSKARDKSLTHEIWAARWKVKAKRLHAYKEYLWTYRIPEVRREALHEAAMLVRATPVFCDADSYEVREKLARAIEALRDGE